MDSRRRCCTVPWRPSTTVEPLGASELESAAPPGELDALRKAVREGEGPQGRAGVQGQARRGDAATRGANATQQAFSDARNQAEERKRSNGPGGPETRAAEVNRRWTRRRRPHERGRDRQALRAVAVPPPEQQATKAAQAKPGTPREKRADAGARRPGCRRREAPGAAGGLAGQGNPNGRNFRRGRFNP